jgi:YD repeat-containing protein
LQNYGRWGLWISERNVTLELELWRTELCSQSLLSLHSRYLAHLTKETVDSSVVGEDYTKTYTLDMVGNRTKLVTSKEGLPTETTISTYNSRDQLLTETTGSTTINYGYDDNGSLKTQSGNGSSRT